MVEERETRTRSLKSAPTRYAHLEHGYPRNQVSRYPGAHILQMVGNWNADLIADS